jgi:hypothetical protein
MTSKEEYKIICTKQKSDLPVFMQYWWLDEVCGSWDVAIAKKGEHVSGVWAYPVEQKMGVTFLRTPPLTPYLGPHVFYPDGLRENKRDSYEHDTVAELVKQLPEAKVWHLALPPGIYQAGIFKNLKLDNHVQQTFLLGLAPAEEALLANMKEATRRNIRGAEAEITIRNDPSQLKELYRFQLSTLGKKGKDVGYTAEYLQKIMGACIANGAAALWVAKSGDKTEAIVWQVWDGQTSYYLMGAQNPGTTSYRAMTLLMWHMIREAKKRGNAHFDFEGSMDEGVERFFRNFGAERNLYLVLHRNDSLLWKLKKVVLK